jgi:flagellar protein FlaJ
MSSLKEFSFNLFRDYLDKLIPLFPDLKIELKQSGMNYTVQEYISLSLFMSMIALIAMLPLMSFIFSVIFADFLFGFMLSVLASFGGAAGLFFGAIQYPKTEIDAKSKDLESALPFAAMYLSTIAGAKLPLYKTFDIFTKFAKSGEMRNQAKKINEDIKLFGYDIGTALQRAIDRSPSKKFKEMLYGMSATLKSGGNMNIYLKEKSVSLMGDYRRKLYEFSHSLMVFVEIYLTAIILGAIFFTVLTAIISGIAGAGGDLILLQFFLIFVFIPMISFVFIFLIRTSSPGEE